MISVLQSFLLWVFFLNSNNDDKINFLPGIWPIPSFNQYSGYLDGATSNIKLHYWLVEAKVNPEKAPLVLWLNGGPGCSSLLGLLTENGPFNVGENSRLIINPHSWNNIANVLYLESPAGVGFSYAIDGNITTDDDFTTLNNYHALVHFLEKFPMYKDRDFYISGESYAGVYIPLLTLSVIQNKIFNLKGILVGNGLKNYRFNENSLVYFINYHGIIDESYWDKLMGNCCEHRIDDSKCMFTDSESEMCKSLLNYVSNDAIRGLNIYDVYSPCAGGVKNSSNKQFKYPQLFKFLNQTSAIPCDDSHLIEDYLNMPVVQQAIHTQIKLGRKWEVCNMDLNLNYIRTYEDLTEQYLKIYQSNIPMLFYNGDIDMACNYFGDDWFVDQLRIKIHKVQEAWYYNDVDQTVQIGGYYKVYKDTDSHAALTIATVRGAGHTVPTSKPIPALHILSKFIQSKSL